MKLYVIIILNVFGVSLFAQSPTYTEDIAPIIYNNCSICHRTGEIGPMSLTNYEEVKNWGLTIKYVTSIKYMPPWQPNPEYSRFQEENFLTDDQIALISDWVDDGMEEGDKSQEPQFPDFPEGSAIGTPDLVLKMSESYLHLGNNLDEYRYFVLPTGLTEDKKIKAIEFRPGNKKILHHALLFEDTSGKAALNDAVTPEYGFDGFGGFTGGSQLEILTQKQFPGYVPGQKAQFYPDGVGQTLKANSDLVIQIHYAPWPNDEWDQSEVNIFFADDNELVEREVRSHIMVPFQEVIGELFIILPNRVSEFHGVWEVPADISLFGLSPHMHLLGKSWEIYIENQDGSTENLIKIDNWDFNWQGAYYFNKYKIAKAGSKIHAIASYDNTEDNPTNPNFPPKFVSWGEGTTDEMFFLPLNYVMYREGDEDVVFSDNTTAIKESDDGQIKNKILPLSPNPINDYAKVVFTLDHASSISIDVYSISGEKIRNIRRNEFFGIGNNQIYFSSSQLVPGSYIIKITGQDFTMTQKFLKQ